MVSLDDAGDRAAMMKMNAELRQAQLEMLSAQCATDRLRLRYSIEEIARNGQRDILRKAWASASALFEYYNAIAKQSPDQEAFERPSPALLSEAQVKSATERLARYLHEQREYFRPVARPLERNERQTFEPFFSSALLAEVRIVALGPQRISNPPFYLEARSMGFSNLPDIPHMSSLTFEDVLVFQRELTNRGLFHALVHAVQVEVLGLERYAELIVSGLMRTRSYARVPLEAHAFRMESSFADNERSVFSVAEKVRLWANQGRY